MRSIGVIVGIGAGLFGLGAAPTAQAQDYGATLGVVTPYGAKGVGNAVSGAIGRAATAVRQTAPGPSWRGGQAPRRGGAHRGATTVHFASQGRADPLRGTDAPTYGLPGGGTIRATGDFTPAAANGSASCQTSRGTIRASGGFRPSTNDCAGR